MVNALRHPRRASVLIALTLAIGAVLTFALLSAAVHPAQAKTHHVVRHAAVHKASETTGESSTETGGSTESSTETSTDAAEQGAPGEPAGGHQDTGTNAGHDCTGNCVE